MQLLKKKLTRVLMLAALMTMLLPATAMAAPKGQNEDADTQQKTTTVTTKTTTKKAHTPQLQDIFDARYYADQNLDVKAAYGYNTKLLYQHFVRYGMKEGRAISPIFDVQAYRAGNPDLEAAYGDDWAAYYRHFVNYGMWENANGQRGAAGVLLNPITYADAYPDVKAVFGNNWQAIIQHYETYGKSEGRVAGTPGGSVTSSTSTGGSHKSSGGSTGGSTTSSGSTGTGTTVTPPPEPSKPDDGEHTKTSTHAKTDFDGSGACKQGCGLTLTEFQANCQEDHANILKGAQCTVCGKEGTKITETNCDNKSGHAALHEGVACSEQCGYVGTASHSYSGGNCSCGATCDVDSCPDASGHANILTTATCPTCGGAGSKVEDLNQLNLVATQQAAVAVNVVSVEAIVDDEEDSDIIEDSEAEELDDQTDTVDNATTEDVQTAEVVEEVV